ncbi:FCD domain-containing protein [Belnapia sp. T6]|uniref:FCD domain-containing protein n=1 Tax=Belnapia mucosa TaxID=2804532 RepID=A0ABS1V4N4_9PROT|nr:FCD domain-containing protein [Belnapia mucosa]MBL6456647.1 FCD domain-containing protein [Belnapia mucosa]
MNSKRSPPVAPPDWGPSSRLLRSNPPRTLADEALLRIRADIVAGRLGAGERLQPDLLEVRYGLGRSPIREALSRLATEGLVHGEGQRGFAVSPLSEAELLDIAGLRRRLSTEALALSIARGDEDWEAEVIASFHRLSRFEERLEAMSDDAADEWERRNRDFHRALEAACGSPWLQHFCDILYDQSERYRRAFVRYPAINPAIRAQHEAIMAAAIGRDAARATGLLGDHIMQGAEATLALLRAASPTSIGTGDRA